MLNFSKIRINNTNFVQKPIRGGTPAIDSKAVNTWVENFLNEAINFNSFIVRKYDVSNIKKTKKTWNNITIYTLMFKKRAGKIETPVKFKKSKFK